MVGSWEDARLFMAKGPSARLEFLDDEQRAQLWAYWMQATEGPRSTNAGGEVLTDDRLRRRQAAWAQLGGMSAEQAQRCFVDQLTAAVPDWTSWCRTYGERIKAEQLVGGEEQRLLKAFTSKTGLSFSASRL